LSHTLTQPARHEIEIKKSRFVALAERCRTEQDARDFLLRINDPAATHHCWAWKSGQGYRFDDDGEPGGTAGRPILAAIEHQDLDEVAVVVLRYYGGIKLGTGGLARAYGSSASECLRSAITKPLLAITKLRVHLPFELIAVAHQLLERHEAVKAEELYDSTGIELIIHCPVPSVEALTQQLRDASAGQARIRSD